MIARALPRATTCATGVAFSTCLLLAACGNAGPTGPGPGSTPPGAACKTASDCGCWECACTGVSGAPGAAQLCVGGHCPSGEGACSPVCALAHATVASATSVGTCNGVP
jgi:hypothetical protein